MKEILRIPITLVVVGWLGPIAHISDLSHRREGYNRPMTQYGCHTHHCAEVLSVGIDMPVGR
jgi:hypothetical protein